MNLGTYWSSRPIVGQSLFLLQDSTPNSVPDLGCRSPYRLDTYLGLATWKQYVSLATVAGRVVRSEDPPGGVMSLPFITAKMPAKKHGATDQEIQRCV